MESILYNITANPNSFMFLMIFGVLGLVGLVAILMGSITAISSTKQREQSRREMAVYIANGSISPQDAERLLNPDPDHSKSRAGLATAPGPP